MPIRHLDPIVYHVDEKTHDVMDYEAGQRINTDAIDIPDLISEDSDNCLVVSLVDGKLFVQCSGGGGGDWPGLSDKADNCIQLLTAGEDHTAGLYVDCSSMGGWPGLSEDPLNCIVERDAQHAFPGLFAPCSSGSSLTVSEHPDNCLTLKPAGDEYPGLFIPCSDTDWPGISEDVGNLVVIGGDGGIYVKCCYPGLSIKPDNVATYDDQGQIYVPPCLFEFPEFVSEDPNNCLIVSPNDGKLYVECPEDNQYPGISTDSNNCLELGNDNKLYVKCPEDNQYPGISTDANNCAELGTDGGIFVPCPEPFDPNKWVSGNGGNGLSVVNNKFYVQTVSGPSWLPLYFDLLAGNTIKTMIPPDRTKMCIRAIDSQGANIEVFMAASYQDLPEVKVPKEGSAEDPLNILPYHEAEVTFRITGNVPGQNSVSVLLKLEV